MNAFNTIVTKRADFTKLIDELNLRVGVEVGVNQGHFSEYLLQNSKLEKLYSIDAWLDDQEITRSARKRCEVNDNKMEWCYQETIKKLEKFKDRSIIIRDLSENAVKQFEKESLDFIYLDASHRFSGFTIDMIHFWNKLKYGGLFSGHDFWRKYRYETSYVVNGFCSEHKQLFYLTTDERQFPQFAPSWWLIKTKRDKSQYNDEMIKHIPILKKQAEDIKNIKNIKVDLPYEY